MKHLIFFSLLPFFLYSQDSLVISSLKGKVNTNSLEINFNQINDTLAYFTGFNNYDILTSSIYYSIKKFDLWGNRIYSKFNFDNFNTGEITFLTDSSGIFTSCISDIKCDLIYFSNRSYTNIKKINNKGLKNTQAHFSAYNSQNILYFVSDREGGFGGLDIWLSMIDMNGNFGNPINAGGKINSSSDEISPFVNQNTGTIYFSSNRKTGLGGFDIYKANGRLNLWDTPENIFDFNSINDEMHLVFHDNSSGYFSSNRKGAKYMDVEYCCNDIFTFKYINSSIDSVDQLININNYFPLTLYFHNAEPSSFAKTYLDTYISYFMMKDTYISKNLGLANFFDFELRESFNKLNSVLNILLSELSKGRHVNLIVKGYSSPLHDEKFNYSLSRRRITSFINYLKQFNNGDFTEHHISESLTISELPVGESVVVEKVSDDPNDEIMSIYSIQAIYSRKIEIVGYLIEH